MTGQNGGSRNPRRATTPALFPCTRKCRRSYPPTAGTESANLLLDHRPTRRALSRFRLILPDTPSPSSRQSHSRVTSAFQKFPLHHTTYLIHHAATIPDDSPWKSRKSFGSKGKRHSPTIELNNAPFAALREIRIRFEPFRFFRATNGSKLCVLRRFPDEKTRTLIFTNLH